MTLNKELSTYTQLVLYAVYGDDASWPSGWWIGIVPVRQEDSWVFGYKMNGGKKKKDQVGEESREKRRRRRSKIRSFPFHRWSGRRDGKRRSDKPRNTKT